MIKKIKTNKGITLIALIITIIVLLILALVSIRAITNGGIITKANDAKDRYTIEQEKEKIQIGYSEYKMSQYTEEKLSKPVVDGADVSDLTDGTWNIVFKDTGNRYSLSEDGVITDLTASIEDEKKKIELGYQNYQESIKNVPEDYITLSNYFLGNNLNDLIDEEQSTEDIWILKNINISITKSDLVIDEENGVITINIDYNSNKYALTCDYNTADIQKLEYNLSVEDANVSGNNIKSWYITFNNTGNIYILETNGTIRGPLNGITVEVPKTETGEVDFETVKSNVTSDSNKYLEIAAGKGQKTINNTDIGIGTDGQVVNLDLWIYTLSESNTVKLGTSGSYR